MDTKFSVYEHTKRTVAEHGGTVHDIGTVEKYEPSGQRGAVGFGTRLGGMLHWCRVVEHMVAERKYQDAVLWAGFEKLSRLGPALARYQRLSGAVSRLVLIGAPDVRPQLAGAELVPIYEGPLLAEWFLLVRCSRYCALLAARDLDGLAAGSWSKARRFQAIATHDPQLIDSTAEALDRALASAP